VAFRVFLAIPHFIFLALLSIALLFAAVAGWFAALVTGRLPGGIATFAGRVLRYQAQVYGYAVLLITDRYPPFSLNAPDYAISVAYSPTRLNRAAVLFRLVLLVPVAFVTWLLGSGL